MKKIYSFLLALLASTTFSYANLITVDGDFSDWNALPDGRMAQASLGEVDTLTGLYQINFCADENYIYFYFEYDGSAAYYLAIHMDVDGNASTGWNGNWWSNMATDCLLEGSEIEGWWANILAYTGDGSSWDWERYVISDEAASTSHELLNGHRVMEGRIVRADFPAEITNLNLGVASFDDQWNKTGSLPYEHTALLNVPLSGDLTNLQTINASDAVDGSRKFFRDGHLLIERGGKLYNATGAASNL